MPLNACCRLVRRVWEVGLSSPSPAFGSGLTVESCPSRTRGRGYLCHDEDLQSWRLGSYLNIGRSCRLWREASLVPLNDCCCRARRVWEVDPSSRSCVFVFLICNERHCARSRTWSRDQSQGRSMQGITLDTTAARPCIRAKYPAAGAMGVTKISTACVVCGENIQ